MVDDTSPALRDEPTWVRAGLWLLSLGGLLTLFATVVRGPYIDAASQPHTFLAAAASGGFLLGWGGILGGLLLTLLGMLALAHHLGATYPRLAVAGSVLAVVGAMAGAGVLGVFLLVAPTLAGLGDAGVSAIAGAMGGSLTQGTFAAAGAAYIAASLLFAAGIWAGGTLPRWTAVVLGLQGVLALGTFVSWYVELLDAVLLLAAGVGIAAEVSFEHRFLATEGARARAG